MAGIRKLSSNWNVQIRRSGHPPLSKTFKFKADAIHWANKTEALLDRGGSVLTVENIDIKTLEDLLIKFRIIKLYITKTFYITKLKYSA